MHSISKRPCSAASTSRAAAKGRTRPWQPRCGDGAEASVADAAATTRSARSAAASSAGSARDEASRSTTRTPGCSSTSSPTAASWCRAASDRQLRQAPARDRRGGQPRAHDRAHAVRSHGSVSPCKSFSKTTWTTSASPARSSTSSRATARNFLLPRGQAIKATAERRQARRAREAGHRGAHRQARQGGAGRGRQRSRRSRSRSRARSAKRTSSSARSPSRDIAEALGEQGVRSTPRRSTSTSRSRRSGLAEVPVKLGRGVTATIKVWVVKKEE